MESLRDWKLPSTYKLERILGKGAYGSVAKGTDGKGNPVAVKFMKEIFQRFSDAKTAYREMRLLRHLQHHNVVKLKDVILYPSCLIQDEEPSEKRRKLLRDRGDLYLIFEFLDTDLSKLLSSHQFLTLPHVQRILNGILLGLRYIHSANVIHRDLKPANILVNCTDCTTKIADFGLARVVDRNEICPQEDCSGQSAIPIVHNSPTRERAGDVAVPPSLPNPTVETVFQQFNASSSNDLLGPPLTIRPVETNFQSNFPIVQRQLTHHVATRWYRSPELILTQPYTAAVDMWSVGCIFAELLGMMKGNRGGVLFPGDRCGDLSGGGWDDPDNSQLNVIFEVIGTPSDEDISFLSSDALHRVKQFHLRPAENLHQRFPVLGSQNSGIELLKSMLAFDPRRRISVDDALKHPFLSAFYQEEQFQGAVCREPLMVDVEMVGEDPDNLSENIINEAMHYLPPRAST